MRPVFAGEELKGLEKDQPNRAKDLIAEFMIASNGVTSRYLASRKFPALQRVVRTPKRWDRIVAIAAGKGTMLPETPNSKALEKFLASAKAADPVGFPDLSLSVIKSLGSGEYVVQLPGDDAIGHFGLAVKDYSSLHRPEPPLPRRDHAAVAESSHGGRFSAL